MPIRKHPCPAQVFVIVPVIKSMARNQYVASVWIDTKHHHTTTF